MKNINLSLLLITKNSEKLLTNCLESCKDLVGEIVIIDNYSTDKTIEIAKKYNAKIFLNRDDDLGKQRAYGLKKCTYKWVLVLDADEILSLKVSREIREVLSIKYKVFSGFSIPFQNHFLGRPINRGGENYKMLRLFKKDSVTIEPAFVHERFKIKKGRAGELKNKIYHYSYRSILQMFKKFTDYAVREARQKAIKGETTGLKKILLYPPHMVWARFVKDKGYKDGIFRIPLDLGFGYMEFLTYLLLFFEQSRKSRF